MSTAKKMGKAAKIPQPIKIKKEKSEEDRAIHSMAHYVDDRLELVKQIFGSLKTKTITNLAPEYLKEKDMNEIQELCLNELLCLSKKRLLSIINATKCPTDTESSEDTDVEAKEEHISLEEISSDSEIESGGKAAKKLAAQSRIKKNSKKLNQANDKEAPAGQISVLELLELQARARAIRSQLALEPVTKIEVDSDEEDDATNANVSSTTKDQKNTRKRITINSEIPEKQNSNKSSLKITVSSNDDTTTEQQSNNIKRVQKIKLKRNFRKQMPDSPDADRTQGEQNVQEISKELKKEKLSRSQSPDVIPIEPEPETLCIIDSSSDAEERKRMEVKEKEKTEILEVIINQEIAKSQQKEKNDEEEKEKDEEEEEAEDGEIIESEVENNIEVIRPEARSNLLSTVISESTNNISNGKMNNQETSSSFLHESSIIVKNSVAEANANSLNYETTNDEMILPKINEDIIALSPVHINDSDNDQSDDVISIEGGDLENEMSEHLDDENNSKCLDAKVLKESITSDPEGNDIISLDSSDNEDDSTMDNNSESWQSRYLKSSKVSKVLAVSRLGKRVRDKLRTSKLTKKEIDEELSKEMKNDNKFTSKHEEGSVEQYKELLELSQRKS